MTTHVNGASLTGSGVPRHDPHAEQAVLGAIMQSAEARVTVADILTPDAFYIPAHGHIYTVVLDLAHSGIIPDPVTVGSEIVSRKITVPGGNPGPYIHTCMQACPTALNAGYYADIVAAAAAHRGMGERLARLLQVHTIGDFTDPVTIDQFEADLVNALDAAARFTTRPRPDETTRLTGGGSFFHNVPDTLPAVWGRGNHVLWAQGESLIIAAPQGVGKTTLAHQIIRARIGLQDTVLGYPVVPGRRVLLLAMDRPAQTRRAGARIFGHDDPVHIDRHLVVWEGPPPYDFAQHPDTLVKMCHQAGADTVCVDSIKDSAIGISDDAVGAGYNRARQKALAEGIEVLENHHVVKRGTNGAPPNTLADVYGSTWITSGAGSVLLLWGEAGDPLVSLRHLKQPMEEIGPLRLSHDHEAGTTTVQRGAGLLDLVKYAGVDGLTAKQAAVALFETDTPSNAQVEKARRQLGRLCASGHLHVIDGDRGGNTATRRPSVYYLAAHGPS